MRRATTSFRTRAVLGRRGRASPSPQRDGDDCRRLFGNYCYEPAALARWIRIDDIAQQERILRRHDRIVDGGHGQPEVLQRLADLDRGRI